MIIHNGKKHYASEIRAAKRLPFNGWNLETDLVIVEAASVNNRWGEDWTKYFNSPTEFASWATNYFCDQRTVEELIGEVDEEDDFVMAFISKVFRD